MQGGEGIILQAFLSHSLSCIVFISIYEFDLAGVLFCRISHFDLHFLILISILTFTLLSLFFFVLLFSFTRIPYSIPIYRTISISPENAQGRKKSTNAVNQAAIFGLSVQTVHLYCRQTKPNDSKVRKAGHKIRSPDFSPEKIQKKKLIPTFFYLVLAP